MYIDNYGRFVNDDYLEHHGIMGQKWGVRHDHYPLDAFEHTASEKKAGYKKSIDGGTKGTKKKEGIVRRVTTGDVGVVGRALTTPLLPGMLSGKKHRGKRAYKLDKKAKQAAAEGNEKKAEKLAKKAKAQSQKNADVKKYTDGKSTAKLVLQNLLMTNLGADNYRAARARGEGRVRSWMESGAGINPLSTLLRVEGDRRKYGRLTHSGM